MKPKFVENIISFKGNTSRTSRVGIILTGFEDIKNIDSKDFVYWSHRISSEHYFRIFKGWGLSVDVYNQLIQKKVTKIILDVEGSKFLMSNLNQCKQSERWINETLDGQIDNQYILLESEMELKGGIESEMASLKETAKAYVPKKTRNIVEMEVVNLDTLQVEERKGVGTDGKDFNYKVAIYNNEEYRVPESVLNAIKTILEVKPNLKTVKVVKKGQGMGTEYSVIQLD